MSEYIEQMVDNDEMPEELLAVGDTWKIRDDASADWAIRRIAAVNDDCDRKIAVCKERIANLQKLIDKYQQEKEDRTGWFRIRLMEWFESVQRRVTKTSERYDLPSGRLVRKFPVPEVKRDDDALAAWAGRLSWTEVLKVKVTPDWAKIKAEATIVNGQYVIATNDGEVVPVEGVTLVEREPTFEVEVGR